MNYNTSGPKRKKERGRERPVARSSEDGKKFWVPHCGEFLDYLRLLASLFCITDLT
jgi:hypothetical protein